MAARCAGSPAALGLGREIPAERVFEIGVELKGTSERLVGALGFVAGGVELGEVGEDGAVLAVGSDVAVENAFGLLGAAKLQQHHGVDASAADGIGVDCVEVRGGRPRSARSIRRSWR